MTGSAGGDVLFTRADVLFTRADVLLTRAEVPFTRADVLLTGVDVLLTRADVLLTPADVRRTRSGNLPPCRLVSRASSLKRTHEWARHGAADLVTVFGHGQRAPSAHPLST